MAGKLFTSTELDKDGRQLLLSDSIRNVHYYTTTSETWDKNGAGGQSWFRENFLPNDSFDTTSIASDRWVSVDTTIDGTNTLKQSLGRIQFGVEQDEGRVSVSSNGKWRLSGDFDIRLYVDWEEYYNEYRSVAHTFLKVEHDSNNAVRVGFSFDGSSGFEFRSEKTVGRSPTFFGWDPNGNFNSVSFSTATQVLFFKITRQSGTIRTYTSNGVTDTQIGNDITESVFSNDVFIEFGVEVDEFNTYRSSFSKFFVAEGTTTPIVKFFSPVRGESQSFPDNAIITVDDQSLSILDEDTSTLWMRLNIESSGPVPSSDTKVKACNGTIYCTTADGLIAFDFSRDKIYKYKDSSIFVGDEPIALRNAGVVFRTFASSVGDIPNNNLHNVACRSVAGEEYIAFTHDSGVTVMRALASGVANSSDGPLPGAAVEVSEKGSLYWAGYNQPSNDGELSFFSNITALAGPGTSVFNRTGHYGTDTSLDIFGDNITAFDVRTINGTDLIAVGTTEGITFLSFSPGAPETKSTTYGVTAPAENPFADPSFNSYLALDWKPFYTGLHPRFRVIRSTEFFTAGTHSLKLKFTEPRAESIFQEGTLVGASQTVDLTGVERVYFDFKLVGPGGASINNLWNFEFVVGGTVVKSYKDIDGPFTKFNDSVDVLSFDGLQKVDLQLRTVKDHNTVGTDSREAFIDNLRTKIGDPDIRVLPAGNASILEVLLQYDPGSHKVYFSTTEGYGALDLDDNSLDYFIPLDTFGPQNAETISADFSRIQDEV